MPLPIVPAPTIATRSIARVGVVSGTSAMRAAARSAKNAWRSARDCGVTQQLDEQLALEAKPFVERHRSPPPPRRRCTVAAQAECLAVAATVLRANWK